MKNEKDFYFFKMSQKEQLKIEEMEMLWLSISGSIP